MTHVVFVYNTAMTGVTTFPLPNKIQWLQTHVLRNIIQPRGIRKVYPNNVLQNRIHSCKHTFILRIGGELLRVPCFKPGQYAKGTVTLIPFRDAVFRENEGFHVPDPGRPRPHRPPHPPTHAEMPIVLNHMGMQHDVYAMK